MDSNEIKIIGIGQSGTELLERLQPNTIKNTDLVVCDIDFHTLSRSSVKNKIQLEAEQSKTLTSNFIIEIEKHCQLTTEVDLAMNATINAFDHIDSLFSNDSEMAVLIANLGDTSGSGIIPVIAQIAKKRGLFVAAFVYTPFSMFGEYLQKTANYGLKKLRNDCDLVLVIDNNKLQKLYGNSSLKRFAKKADEIVIRLVKMILTLETTNTNLLNLRVFFKVHQDDQNLFIGIGEASGKSRAKHATEKALKNVLYYGDNIENSSTVYLDIYFGNSEINSNERIEIINTIIQHSTKYVNITITSTLDVALEDSISIMIIAI